MRTLLLCVMLLYACRRADSQKESNRARVLSGVFEQRRNSFEDNAKTTVSVSSRFATGSGVFINAEGDVLTSLHLALEGMSPLFVKWVISNRLGCFMAETLYWYSRLDVLVLRSNAHSDHYAKFANGRVSPASGEVYLIGRKLGDGVFKFRGRYLSDSFLCRNVGDMVSNYLLPRSRFSSGGGIFASEDNSLIGINRLAVNESQTPVPVSGATIGEIKAFLNNHRINFEEID